MNGLIDNALPRPPK